MLDGVVVVFIGSNVVGNIVVVVVVVVVVLVCGQKLFMGSWL